MSSTATTTDPVDSLGDFPDRFSPIIVKELRQGLRQASFVVLFLFVQSVLAIAVVTSLAAISNDSVSARLSAGQAISGFFFGLFGLAVLVLQPMRAIATISSEVKENTIDLLLLTRLNSWRIVFGKWLSLVTQSGLLLVAILPYLMIRYFLGGMNILAEMAIMAFIFLLGGLFCAAGVGISAVKSVIIRTIFVIGTVILFIGLVQGMGVFYVFRSIGGGPVSSTIMTTSEWVFLAVGAVLLISYLTFAFLEFAATRIAPPAENRALRKRFISFLAILIVPTCFAFADQDSVAFLYLSVILILAFSMLDSLSENPTYARLRDLRRLPLFRPGWPDGAWYCLLMLVLAAAWCLVLPQVFRSDPYGYDFQGYDEMRFATGLIAVAFAQPALILALMRNRIKDPPSAYLTCLLGATACGFIVMLMAAIADAEDVIGFLMVPFLPSASVSVLFDDPQGLGYLAMFGVSACYLAITGIIGRSVSLNTDQ